MRIRLAYLRRGEIGDGVCVAESFDCDALPRIGEYIMLAEKYCQVIWDFERAKTHFGIPRRFVVVSIDHYWDRIVAPVYGVYISTLKPEAV